jgi:hypothetical protein
LGCVRQNSHIIRTTINDGQVRLAVAIEVAYSHLGRASSRHELQLRLDCAVAIAEQDGDGIRTASPLKSHLTRLPAERLGANE